MNIGKRKQTQRVLLFFAAILLLVKLVRNQNPNLLMNEVTGLTMGTIVYNVKYKATNRLLKEHYTVSLPKDNLSECIRILNDVSGKSFALIDGTIVLQ